MKYPFASIFARNILSRAIASTAIAGAMTLAPSVYAQETSAIVRGAVSTSSGEPLAGATVMVTSNTTGDQNRDHRRGWVLFGQGPACGRVL